MSDKYSFQSHYPRKSSCDYEWVSPPNQGCRSMILFQSHRSSFSRLSMTTRKEMSCLSFFQTLVMTSHYSSKHLTFPFSWEWCSTLRSTSRNYESSNSFDGCIYSPLQATRSSGMFERTCKHTPTPIQFCWFSVEIQAMPFPYNFIDRFLHPWLVPFFALRGRICIVDFLPFATQFPSQIPYTETALFLCCSSLIAY